MYVMHQRARVAMQEDGTTRETHSAQTRTFGSGMELLRFALRERLFDHRVGGVAYPTTPDRVHLGHQGARSYGLIDPCTRWEVTYDHIEAMRRAKAEYDRRMHYWREIEPEWRPDPRISASGLVRFADNSVELYEVDKRGNRRHRMIEAPSGDACF
jgi:hypothetical protein